MTQAEPIFRGPDRIAWVTTQARRMAEQAFSEDAVYLALQVETRLRCQPPLEDDEIRRIVKSQVGYETHERGIRGAMFARFQRDSERRARFDLMTDEEIEARPSPEWRIDRILPAEGLGMLYGAPGGGKMFLALDWAFSVARGGSWHGREVKRGSVVYVAGEGAGGLGIRVRAWKHANSVTGLVGVRFIGSPVQLLESADVGAFVDVIGPLSPTLVMFDTFARCTAGGDEDRAKDMGLAIEAADTIRRAIGGFVLFLHHPTKVGDKERGSGSFRGAVETVMRLSRPGRSERIILACEKQKDGEEFTPLELRLKQMTLVDQTTSCVIDHYDTDSGVTDAPPLGQDEKRALVVLVTTAKAMSVTEWRTKTAQLTATETSERTFYRIATTLLTGGYVEQPGGRRTPYVPTPLGTATANDLPSS